MSVITIYIHIYIDRCIYIYIFIYVDKSRNIKHVFNNIGETREIQKRDKREEACKNLPVIALCVLPMLQHLS